MAKRHKKHEEEHEAGEAWLLPYSDLMTLLLAVFIVLFAVSKQDSAKMEQMAQSFKGIFEGGSGVLNQGNTILQIEDMTSPIEKPAEPSQPPTEQTKELAQQKQERQMDSVEQALNTYFSENNLSDSVHVKNDGNAITVSLASDVFFATGSADLTATQKDIASKIAEIIHNVQKNALVINVQVSGHTDNVPINTAQYRSNWSLSLDRAVHFLSAMVEGSSLDPRTLSAVGFGDLVPVESNDTEQGRMRNRRVELHLSYENPEVATMIETVAPPADVPIATAE